MTERLLREWSVDEDIVLARLILDGGPDYAAENLGRPRTAIDMRLAFLEDHEIIVTGGVQVHRRIIHQVRGPMKDPLRYHSALGQQIMNECNYRPLSALLRPTRNNRGAKDVE